MQIQLKHDQLAPPMQGFDDAQFERFSMQERPNDTRAPNKKAVQLRARVRFADWAMI